MSLVVGVLLAVVCDDGDYEPEPTRTITPRIEVIQAERTCVDDCGSLLTGARGLWLVRRQPMPTPRAEVASAVIDGRIFIVGGFTENGQNSDIVEVYDPVTDTWSSIEPMPERLDHAMAAAVNGKLYVIGGWRVFGDQLSEAMQIYDPAIGEWQSGPDLPLPRAAGAAVGFGDTIFVMGGVGPEPEVGLAYNTATGEWRRTAPMSAPREHLAAFWL